MINRSKEVAGLLMEIGAVSVSPIVPFTYTSGLKGPIYCDNRKVLSHVEIRNKIIQHFVDLIDENNLKCDSYAGLATAGIPYAAYLSDKYSAPMIYIRGKAKEHGKQNQIEGDYKAGQKILLVEDLVNQAGSLKTAFLGAVEAKLIPIACISIVDYQTPNAQIVLNEIKIPLHSLTNFETITQVALEKGTINNDGKESLLHWQKDPANWKS